MELKHTSFPVYGYYLYKYSENFGIIVALTFYRDALEHLTLYPRIKFLINTVMSIPDYTEVILRTLDGTRERKRERERVKEIKKKEE